MSSTTELYIQFKNLNEMRICADYLKVDITKYKKYPQVLDAVIQELVSISAEGADPALTGTIPKNLCHFFSKDSVSLQHGQIMKLALSKISPQLSIEFMPKKTFVFSKGTLNLLKQVSKEFSQLETALTVISAQKLPTENQDYLCRRVSAVFSNTFKKLCVSWARDLTDMAKHTFSPIAEALELLRHPPVIKGKLSNVSISVLFMLARHLNVIPQSTLTPRLTLHAERSPLFKQLTATLSETITNSAIALKESFDSKGGLSKSPKLSTEEFEVIEHQLKLLTTAIDSLCSLQQTGLITRYNANKAFTREARLLNTLEDVQAGEPRFPLIKSYKKHFEVCQALIAPLTPEQFKSLTKSVEGTRSPLERKIFTKLTLLNRSESLNPEQRQLNWLLNQFAT